MKDCDDKAAREQNALHFARHSARITTRTFVEQWRPRALNRIGNALVLPGDDMLDGLRRKD